MRHKGKVKYTAGRFATDVEPFPRLKIMMLCDIIMGLNKQLPDHFNAKHYVHEWVKFIMQVVDQNESIFEIESKLPQFDSVEDLIMSLHDQVTFNRICIEQKPWEEIERELKDFDYKDFFYVNKYIIFSKVRPLLIRFIVRLLIKISIEKLRDRRGHKLLALAIVRIKFKINLTFT
jgi:hypothetical protein